MEMRAGTMLDETALMARQRVGARGNALTFPMPWEDILQSLQQVVELGQDSKSVDLPHTGSDDLVELVR
eukprot:5830771-Amphidinium_carterae.1